MSGMSRFALAVCLLAVVPLGAGCVSSRAVSGKVLRGDVGIVLLVPESDPRLESMGVGEASVRITEPAGGVASIAEATTAPDGSFTLRLPAERLSERLGVVVTGAGSVPMRATSFLPADDRRLLILVESEEPAR